MIALGSDHAAYEYKELLEAYLLEKGFEVEDFGTHSLDRIDYPVIGEKVARAVAEGSYERGIILCGTGVGISISANKVPVIRCVVCREPYAARLSRQHNDTNVFALGARVVGIELAKMIIDIWLETPFEGGRHQKRVDMLDKLIT